MEQWLNPELWLKGGGISTLLLVGLVFGAAYCARVVWCWAKPLGQSWIESHVHLATTSVKNNERLTTAVETLSDTVGDLCPRVAAMQEAQRHGCEAFIKTIKDPETKAAVEPHLAEIRQALRPRTT